MYPSKETIDNWKEIFSKRPEDALPPVYEDLEFLYDYVTEKKPFTILEFGSGCSTLVMAEASKKEVWIGVTVFSYDNEQKWLMETKKMISNDLDYVVDLGFALTHKYVWFDDTPVFSYFYHTLTLCPNLIYLDGPELTEVFKVTVDPLFYEHKMYKGDAIIVDGREETVEFLKQHFLRKWKYTHKDIGDNGMSIFELEE